MNLTFPDHVTITETEYGLVLLDQRQGRYWRLNPTAALVVETLRDGGSQRDATRRVIEIFDVDRPRAEHDTASLLADMRAAGVIRP